MALHPLDDAHRATTCTSTIRRNHVSAGREREGCQNSPIIGLRQRRVKRNRAPILANPKIWSLDVTGLRFLDDTPLEKSGSRRRMVFLFWPQDCSCLSIVSRTWEPSGVQSAAPAISQKEAAPMMDSREQVVGFPFGSLFWEASDWPLRNKPLLHWKRLSFLLDSRGNVAVRICRLHESHGRISGFRVKLARH
jgi:hypothetical protein